MHKTDNDGFLHSSASQCSFVNFIHIFLVFLSVDVKPWQFGRSNLQQPVRAFDQFPVDEEQATSSRLFYT